jgi:hypothetical protein
MGGFYISTNLKKSMYALTFLKAGLAYLKNYMEEFKI